MKQRIRLVETCSGDAMNQSGSLIHLPNDRLATKQLFPIERLRTDSPHYFIDKWTFAPGEKRTRPAANLWEFLSVIWIFKAPMAQGAALAEH